MQRLRGVALTDEEAAEIAAALDALARLAADRGARLSPRLVEIRRGLTGAPHAITHPDMRTGAEEVLGAFTLSQGVVDTATAATALGLTPDGVRYLYRAGRLPATWSAGRWWIDTDTLDQAVTARREAGRL